MTELAQRLHGRSGKKQYGYLPPALKFLMDEIVTELEKDPRIAAAYDLWYREREEVLRTRAAESHFRSENIKFGIRHRMRGGKIYQRTGWYPADRTGGGRGRAKSL